MPGILDEAGNAWHKEEEHRCQMMEGVEGSHLCIPFQCKLCWFRNIKGRDPVPGRDDTYMTLAWKVPPPHPVSQERDTRCTQERE